MHVVAHDWQREFWRRGFKPSARTMQSLDPDRTACSQSVRGNSTEPTVVKDHHSAKAVWEQDCILMAVLTLTYAAFQRPGFITKSNTETLSSRSSLDTLLKKLSKRQAGNFCLLKSLFSCQRSLQIPGNCLPRHNEISILLWAFPVSSFPMKTDCQRWGFSAWRREGLGETTLKPSSTRDL